MNLTDPDNGEVTLSGTQEGSQATYSCSAGYHIVGSGTRTCRSDGQWSGSDPACQSEWFRLRYQLKYLMDGLQTN